MAPSEADKGGEKLSHCDIAEDDSYQRGWVDFSCTTPWEDFIRSLEDVLRDWRACHTDLVEDDDSGPPSSPSKCLEHDGQLFSIQLVPAVVHPHHATIPPTAATQQQQQQPNRTPTKQLATQTNTTQNNKKTRSPPKSATSRACELANGNLDFSADPDVTPIQRWFGLKQYILLRALGHEGGGGMGIDQLLWATTVASGNCECSIPVLVSCDWDGLDREEKDGEGAGMGGRWGGASCKGYSAPGSKGVACSVRFQTASTEKPPSDFLFLDGLSALFISKLRDVHGAIPMRAFSPTVISSVEYSWLWIKPEANPPILAPSLPCKKQRQQQQRPDSSGGGDEKPLKEDKYRCEHETPERRESDGRRTRTNFPVRVQSSRGEGGREERADWRMGGSDDGGETVEIPRMDAVVHQLIRAIGWGNDGNDGSKPLWGPAEDPLVSVAVRVRWTDLRDGLVEENVHFSTLNPMQGVVQPAVYPGGDDFGGLSGQWFVKPRWKAESSRRSLGSSRHNPPENERLASACFRLLAALVVTTTMHPGTLVADLGAAAGADNPTVIAEDYAKAAAALLSAETKASVERMCSKSKAAPMDSDSMDHVHDKIDLILRHLLHPDEAQEETNEIGRPCTAVLAPVWKMTKPPGGGGSSGRSHRVMDETTAALGVCQAYDGMEIPDGEAGLPSSRRPERAVTTKPTEPTLLSGLGSSRVPTGLGLALGLATPSNDCDMTAAAAATGADVNSDDSENTRKNNANKYVDSVGGGAASRAVPAPATLSERKPFSSRGSGEGEAVTTTTAVTASEWRQVYSREAATTPDELLRRRNKMPGKRPRADTVEEGGKELASPGSRSGSSSGGDSKLNHGFKSLAESDLSSESLLRPDLWRTLAGSTENTGPEEHEGGSNGGRGLRAEVGDRGVKEMKGGGVDGSGEKSLWVWANRGGTPVGRLLSLLATRIADCDDLATMSLLWMSFVRDIRLLWEEGVTLARMQPIPELDGVSMFDDGTRGTGQSRGIAAQLRSRQVSNRANGGDSGRFRRERRGYVEDSQGMGSGRGGGGIPYPDTRMCLIWQKLQMLNCCRMEAQQPLAAGLEIAAGGEAGGCWSGLMSTGQCDNDGDDDEREFYDTLEYAQQSDGEEESTIAQEGERRQQEEQKLEQQQQQQQQQEQQQQYFGEEDGGHGNNSPGNCRTHGESDPLPAAESTAETLPGAEAESNLEARHAEVERNSGDPVLETSDSERERDGCDLVPEKGARDVQQDGNDDARSVSVATTITSSTSTNDIITSPAAAAVEAEASGERLSELPSSSSSAMPETVEGEVSVDNGRRRSTSSDSSATAIPNNDKQQHQQHHHHHGDVLGITATGSSSIAKLFGVPPNQPPPLPPAAQTTLIGSAGLAGLTTESAGDSTIRLLRNGVEMQVPVLRANGPLTEDMLEQQKLRQAGIHRGREVLVADMEAFREANGGETVFADFVRWYRPDCWQSLVGGEDGMTASEDRSGGRLEDDLRLAWSGQGQVLWRCDHGRGSPETLPAKVRNTTLLDAQQAASPAYLTLATWLSCWGDSAGAAAKSSTRCVARAPLFNGVKEGEKALHYLETISPGPLLVQLLCALLGLSTFVLEEGCSSSPANGLAALEDVTNSARRAVKEAVELLAGAIGEASGGQTRLACDGAIEDGVIGETIGPTAESDRSESSSLRAALVAADLACLEVKRAESTLSKAVSLQRALSGQDDLVNAMVKFEAEGSRQEALVESDGEKMFVRDLLRDQLRQKPPASVDELLASMENDQNGEGENHGSSKTNEHEKGESAEYVPADLRADGNNHDMPTPATKKYVLRRSKSSSRVGMLLHGWTFGSTSNRVFRCQSPAPFYSRNIGRPQLEAYPTPPSRMYAKTDGKGLRVALSLCESDL